MKTHFCLALNKTFYLLVVSLVLTIQAPLLQAQGIPPQSTNPSVSGDGSGDKDSDDDPATPDDNPSPDEEDSDGEDEMEPQEEHSDDDCACSEDDADTPESPGSVNYTIGLTALPNEPGLTGGMLRLYQADYVANLADPVLLNYASPEQMRITNDLADPDDPTLTRITIIQASGFVVTFAVRQGESTGWPMKKVADSRARITLLDASGAPTGNHDTATQVMQYRANGGIALYDRSTRKLLTHTTRMGRTVSFPDPRVEIIREEPTADPDERLAIRQIKSPAGLLDVEVLSERSYSVKKYLPGQIGAKGARLYSTAGMQPAETHTFSHAAGTGELSIVKVIHASGAGNTDLTESFLYTVEDTGVGVNWTQARTVGTSTIIQERREEPLPQDSQRRSVVRRTMVDDGTGMQTVYSNSEIQEYMSWEGWKNTNTLTFKKGNEGRAVSRERSYYTDASERGRYGRMRRQTTESGSFFEYDYNDAGLLAETKSPWLDGENGDLIIKTYDYTPLVAEDVILLGDERPRTKTVTIRLASGQESVLSRKYFAAFTAPDGRYTMITERAAHPDAAYGDSRNLRVTQIFYAGDDSDRAAAGRLFRRIAEDGVIMEYSYSGGTPEQPALTTITTSLLDPTGSPVEGKSMRTTSQEDGRGVVELTRSAIFVNSTWLDYMELETAFELTGQSRSTTEVDLLSGRRRPLDSYQWRGRLRVSRTDEQGITTIMKYDDFLRSAGMIRAAAPALGAYPAQPAIETSYSGGLTQGVNESPSFTDKVTTISAGSLQMKSAEITDTQNRLGASTDVNGYTTSYSRNVTNTETTRTLPSGATIVTRKHLDGRTESITGTGVVPTFYAYTPRAAGGIITTMYNATPTSPRHTITHTDMLGRTIQVESPTFQGNLRVNTNTYEEGTNRMLAQASDAPSTPTSISEYNSLGQVIRSGSTIRDTLTLDPRAEDRVSDSDTVYEYDATSGQLWRASFQRVYPTPQSSGFTLGTSRTKVAGFTNLEIRRSETTDSAGNVSSTWTDLDRASALLSTYSVRPTVAGRHASITHYGRLVETQHPAEQGSSFYHYDALGRSTGMTSPRHATATLVTYVQNTGGSSATATQLVESQTDAAGHTTSLSYYPQGALGAGQVALITRPDNTTVRKGYDLLSREIHTWGTASYAMAYSYDIYGQRDSLTTWRDIAGANLDATSWPLASTPGDTTRWHYHESTGLLSQKEDAAGEATSYSYDDASRLILRQWARGEATSYSHTEWGELDRTEYTDATPHLDFDYDTIGRMITATQGGNTHQGETLPTNRWETAYQHTGTRVDGSTGLLSLAKTSETITYSLASPQQFQRELHCSYDSLLRKTGYALSDATTTEQATSYTFDPFSRLRGISSNNAQNLAGKNYAFEYSYHENSAQLLTECRNTVHNTRNTYEAQRDHLVTRRNKLNAATSALSRYDYTVDSLGRRTELRRRGSAETPARETWNYNPKGELILSNHSSNNNYDRAYQFDELGNRLRSADATNLPTEQNHLSNRLNQLTMVNNQTRTYDVDGNLVDDSQKEYQWDAENRLTAVRDRNTGETLVSYHYDYQSRRYAKVTNDEQITYVYHDWNPIAEYTSSEASPSRELDKTYTWGQDISDSMQGAGGVGGLLAVYEHTNQIDSTATASADDREGVQAYFPTYDGNGNVTQYIDASGTTVAHYQYDAFGNTVASSGSKREDFNHRFSTKPYEKETEWYYYGYRYYDPVTGRWPSRDPIAERGGFNLYRFVKNSPLHDVDRLGLIGISEEGAVPIAAIASVEWSVKGSYEKERCCHKATLNAEIGISGGFKRIKKKKKKIRGVEVEAKVELALTLAKVSRSAGIDVCYNEDSGELKISGNTSVGFDLGTHSAITGEFEIESDWIETESIVSGSVFFGGKAGLKLKADSSGLKLLGTAKLSSTYTATVKGQFEVGPFETPLITFIDVPETEIFGDVGWTDSVLWSKSFR